VRCVQTFVVRPLGLCKPFVIKVDGLRLLTRGTIRISVSGCVGVLNQALSRGPPGTHADKIRYAGSAETGS